MDKKAKTILVTQLLDSIEYWSREANKATSIREQGAALEAVQQLTAQAIQLNKTMKGKS